LVQRDARVPEVLEAAGKEAQVPVHGTCK
jgi:hypothetical protein